MHARPTTRRAAFALAAVTVAALGLTACSGGDDAAGPEATSPARPTTTVDVGTGGSGGGSGGDELELPDVGDLADELGDCAQVVLAYTQLAVTILEGDNARAKVDEVLAEVRAKVPADLRDELEVVGATYAKAAEAGITNLGAAFDDPTFKSANTAVRDWLEQECGGG